MQRRDENEDPMSCTVHALASKLKLPEIRIPHQLHNALKYIYNQKRESTATNSNLQYNYIRCIKSLSNTQTITQRDYLVILTLCLYLIQYEEDLDTKQFKLLNYALEKSDFKNRFKISIKCTNKNSSVIRNCDVSLRDTNTKKVIFTKIVEILGNDIIIRTLNSEEAKILEDGKKRFNINFVNRHWPLKCCHYAIKIISKCNWIEIVYPQLKTDCTDMKLDIEWINTDMKENEQQKQAVEKILNKTAYPAPYIIFGPPGTGKTATLVEAICQIVKQFPMKNILVCTVSNAAADEITKRLIKIIPINLIHRMYAPSKEWAAVHKEIRPCVNFVEETAILLSKELLLLKKIIITTLITATRLIDINFRENHFSYIIIDEASQATEPEILIPLAITNKNSEDDGVRFQAQIVIAGDPHQLGPVVRCKRIEHLLGKSILERLMNDCDPYKKQDGKYNPNYITQLVKNYRSHENLLYVSNKQFYNKELKICGGIDTRMALNWSQLPNKNFPMIFQEVQGTEERSETQSVFNTTEVLAVMTYVDMLIRTKFGKRAVTPKDIGIVTPFKQQQLDISHHLAAMNLENITVGTVETFQGQERNVMILSTVRSKIFKHNDKEHIGFLSNYKRCNVALTRAKALMIIIGNPDIICTNEHWAVLWKYCKKHNACIPSEQLPLNKDIIATFENNSKVKLCDDNHALSPSESLSNLREEEI